MSNKLNNKKSKIVGYINDNIADEWNINAYSGNPIYQSSSFFKHVQRHIKDFESIDSFQNALINVQDIILNPNFVCYNNTNKSLEYYKKLNEFVCIAVKLNEKNNKFYVTTLYPVRKDRAEKKLEKNMLNKYVKNFDCLEYEKNKKQNMKKN